MLYEVITDVTNESITKKLELIPEKVIISDTQERYEPETSDTVFVVHGHDDEAKVSVRITSYNVCYTKLLRISWMARWMIWRC